MDFSGSAFPKPGKTRGPLRAEKFDWGIRFPDGREVCGDNYAGKTEYKRRVAFMVDRQKGICCICHDPFNRMSYEVASFEHGDLRGMGGGRRNDSVDAKNEKGEYVNGAAHGFCNGMKGSKR